MNGHTLLTSCRQTIVIFSSVPLIRCGEYVYFWKKGGGESDVYLSRKLSLSFPPPLFSFLLKGEGG